MCLCLCLCVCVCVNFTELLLQSSACDGVSVWVSLSQLVKEETCSRALMREGGGRIFFFFFLGFSVWLMGSPGSTERGLWIIVIRVKFSPRCCVLITILTAVWMPMAMGEIYCGGNERNIEEEPGCWGVRLQQRTCGCVRVGRMLVLSRTGRTSESRS